MEKYKINDLVIYMSKKIYRITNEEVKDFGDGPKIFYVLTEENKEQENLYLPKDNELVLKKIRHLLTKKEINKAIDDSFKLDITWNPLYKERALIYENLLKENDMSKILATINLIYEKKREQENIKKSLLNVDANFLNNILNVISEEFAYVLQIEKDKVVDYILARKPN